MGIYLRAPILWPNQSTLLNAPISDWLSRHAGSPSGSQIGRVVGKPVVNFDHPVTGASGNVKAIVFLALDLTWLNDLAKQAELPQGSTLTLFD